MHNDAIVKLGTKKATLAGVTTGVRLYPSDKALLQALKDKTGLATTSIVRMALRALAENLNVTAA